MKRILNRTQEQSAALAVTLVLLVMGSGVSLLHAFARMA
jgi:hypothetical protein